jgi:hypothetical protein
MSLRDFNQADDRPTSLQNEPVGNGSGLGSFHTVNPEDVAPSNTPKIVGALAVALIVGAAGIAVYSFSGSKPVTMASNQPASAPVASAPIAPPPQQIADASKAAKAATTDPNSMRSAMGKTPSAMDNAPARSAPVKTKTASAKPARSTRSSSALPGSASARMAADSNQASQQPQQQAVIAQPVSPTPSPSDVATTNTQSGAAVPQGATTASDMPAASAAAPAQAQPAAPAQSAGQGNQ